MVKNVMCELQMAVKESKKSKNTVSFTGEVL